MAEGILTLYTANSWTNNTQKKTKVRLHWMLQVAGSALAIAGNSIIIKMKSENHFVSTHALLGLISFVFLVITCLNGVLALYAVDVKRFVKPVYNKLFHSTLSVIVFVTGMSSLIYGYDTNWMKRFIGDESQHHLVWLEVGTGLTILLTIPGVCYTLFYQSRGLFSK